MKYRWTFHPEDYRLGENESFYARMAERGWELRNRGGYFSSFARTEPRRMLYRMELDPSAPSEDRLALYEECGWEWVTHRGAVNIYRAPAGSGAPELYTDAESQAKSVRRMRRRYILDLLLALAAVPLLWLLISRMARSSSNAARQLLVFPELYTFYLASVLYALGTELAGVLVTSKLLRGLRRGQMPDHSPRVRRPLAKPLLVATWCVCLALTAAQLALYDKTDMPETSDGPYVTLSELGFDGERNGILTHEPDARVERIWAPLADAVWTRETVGESLNWAVLDQYLYDVRSEWLARALFEPLMGSAVFARSADEFTRVELDGWDDVRVTYKECLARRGGRIVYLYMSVPNEYTPEGPDLEEKTEYYFRVLRLLEDR